MGKKRLTKIYVNVEKNPNQINVLLLTFGFFRNQKCQWTLVLMVMGQHFCNTNIFSMNMKMVDYRAFIKRRQRLFCKSLRY